MGIFPVLLITAEASRLWYIKTGKTYAARLGITLVLTAG